MNKKLATMLLTVCALAATATCFAQITAKEAIEIGKKEVPAVAVNYGTKTEVGEIKVFFFDDKTNVNYEVEIDSATGKVKELEIVGNRNIASNNIVKTEAEIRKIVLAKYPDAQNLFVKLDKEDNATVYEAEFFNPKYLKAELKLSPVTGDIGKEELKYR